MLALGKWLELTLAGREPTEKIQLTARGVKLHWLAEGAMQILPPASLDQGVDLVLSAGIHGNEIVPIALLDRLIRRIARGELIPRVRLLCLLGNPGAIRRGQRFLETDLNRLFLGAHAEAGGDEAFRAAELERLVKGFFGEHARQRQHLDLHSAMRASRLAQFAICPVGPQPLPSSETLERLGALAIEGLVLQQRVVATFSAHTATVHQAEAFTLELSEAPSLARCEDGLQRLLAGEAASSSPGVRLFRVAQEVVRPRSTFHLCLPSDIENFAPLPRGTLLAEEAGGQRWLVEEDDAHILFPMPQVAVGQRAALVVVPCQAQALSAA